jgi:KDO2-lipid IV(A) lauroyltransferase
MDTLLYFAGRSLIAFIQALPLLVVVRLGRLGGAATYWFDARHRKVTLKNLAMCYPEKSRREITALAMETLRRIGESFACGIKTAGMTYEQLKPHLEFVLPPEFMPVPGQPLRRFVVAIGHFGNFELYARFGQICTGYQGLGTYRSLRQKSLTRLLVSLREKSGCVFFERRFEADQLKAAMNKPGALLGLMCDQNAGRHGLQIPFLGHNAATSPAVALLAQRYHCPLHTGACFRLGPGRWRVEVGPAIPLQEDGQARSLEAIMRDVNAAMEAAVRRDPANWFWVHNRWKRGVPGAATPATEG